MHIRALDRWRLDAAGDDVDLAQDAAPAVTGSAVHFGTLLVTSAIGVLVVAVAFAGARLSHSWADALFWTGLLIIMLPVTVRLVGQRATRAERLALVIALGLALYAVKVMMSPAQFVLHDELGAYRSIEDILRTGHLYKPINPVDGAYSAYSGIVSITAALSRLSGLGIVPCGLILIGVAKALVSGGLFLFVERCTRSARLAGIASLIYVANPNFVFFDAQFAYESLALGIGAAALWMTTWVADDRKGGWGDVVIAALLEGALVLTHHLTSYAIAIVIASWAVIAATSRRRPAATVRLAVLAGFSIAITIAYFLATRRATESDIGGSIVGSFQALYSVVSGVAQSKAPFTSAAGYSNPPLEQAIGLLSVALLLLAWPFGLLASWLRRRVDPGILVLGLAALLYPISLALRLTAAGSETSNRTSEFIFVGLGASLALALLVFVGHRLDREGWRGWSLRLLITAGLGVTFVGGITVGNAAYDLLPSGYEVAADGRSIDTEGVAAATWAARHLTPDKEFLANETDTELLTAYTELRPQSGTVQGVRVGELFVSPVFGPAERQIITTDKLRYLIVDGRDATELPHSGHYFDNGDPEQYSSPISAQGLFKFNGVGCIDRIFSSGNIVIYDAGRVLGGCK